MIGIYRMIVAIPDEIVKNKAYERDSKAKYVQTKRMMFLLGESEVLCFFKIMLKRFR